MRIRPFSLSLSARAACSRAGRRPSEYVLLMCFACVSATLQASTEDRRLAANHTLGAATRNCRLPRTQVHVQLAMPCAHLHLYLSL